MPHAMYSTFHPNCVPTYRVKSPPHGTRALQCHSYTLQSSIVLTFPDTFLFVPSLQFFCTRWFFTCPTEFNKFNHVLQIGIGWHFAGYSFFSVPHGVWHNQSTSFAFAHAYQTFVPSFYFCIATGFLQIKFIWHGPCMKR